MYSPFFIPEKKTDGELVFFLCVFLWKKHCGFKQLKHIEFLMNFGGCMGNQEERMKMMMQSAAGDPNCRGFDSWVISHRRTWLTLKAKAKAAARISAS